MRGLSDAQLGIDSEILKVFESTRSYKASLLIQAMRLAEMEGRIPDRDRLKDEAEAARAKFAELSDVTKKIQTEIDARTAAKEEAAKGSNANNANAKK